MLINYIIIIIQLLFQMLNYELEDIFEDLEDVK